MELLIGSLKSFSDFILYLIWWVVRILIAARRYLLHIHNWLSFKKLKKVKEAKQVTEKFIAAHRVYQKNGFKKIQKQELPETFPVMEVDNKFLQPFGLMAKNGVMAMATAIALIYIRKIQEAHIFLLSEVAGC